MRIALQLARSAVVLAASRRAVQVVAVSVVLLLTAPGCATNANVRFDEREDFSRFRTWSWLTPGAGTVNAPVGVASALRAKIAGRIREAFAARGLRYADQGADLLVDFQFSIEKRYEVVTTTPAMQYVPSLHSSGSYHVQVGRRELRTFEIARLAIILSDPTRGEVVWHGDFVGHPREIFAAHDVDEALSTLLNRLPLALTRPREGPAREHLSSARTRAREPVESIGPA